MIITIDNKPPINIVDDKAETSIHNTIKEFVETNYDNVEKIKFLLELLKSNIKNTVKVETGNGTPGTGNGTGSGNGTGTPDPPGTGNGPPDPPGTGTGPPETPGTGNGTGNGNGPPEPPGTGTGTIDPSGNKTIDPPETTKNDYAVNNKVLYLDEKRNIKIYCSIAEINGDGTYTLKFGNDKILTNVKKGELSPVIMDNCPSKNIEVVGIEEYCKTDKGRYTGTTSNNASLLIYPDKNPDCILEAKKKFQDQTNYCETRKPTTGGSRNKLDIVTSAIINSAKKIIIKEIKSVKK
jgi:hypothetical protein